MSLNTLNINFNKLFLPACLVSLFFIFSTFVIIFTKGLNLGVDFRGGAEVQVRFEQSLDVQELRKNLDATGFQISSVQSIGDLSNREFLIKVLADEKNISKVNDDFSKIFAEKYATNKSEIRKTDIVGPKAGEELRASGIKALIWSMLLIMIYVGLRFDFKYAPGAVIALIHDVIITVGVYLFSGREFTLQTVAALLTIVGYSVNDTVIIYDRIRENEMKFSGLSLTENVNRSINETLSRSIYTSLTTFTVSLIMWLFGGSAISDFFFALTTGVVVGSYSTTFVASPITILLDKYFYKKSSTQVAKPA